MQTFTKATTVFTLYAMTSARMMHTQENNTEASKFIETFLKGFVGDAFTTELQARFTSRIQSETMGLQKALDHLLGGEFEVQEFMDIVLSWPAFISELTDEGSEKVEAFYEWAADYADAETIEGLITSSFGATSENTAISNHKGAETSLAQVQNDTASCWKTSYGRGVGHVRSYCPPGKENDAGLCYPKCEEGYYGVGPVCWQYCPDNHTDIGLFCWKPNAWDSCPNDMPNAFWSCTKRSYGRGVGTIPECNPGDDAEGLCYKKCEPGYHGVGPVCWGQCKPGTHQCGGLCQADSESCGAWIAVASLNVVSTAVSFIAQDYIGGAAGIISIGADYAYPVCSHN